MSTDDEDLPQAVRTSWHRFADTYEPLRSELYRYCRYLTRSPWDAEDLAQDTLARAFATLGRMGEAPPSPRAWLFRVASNLWIDRMRRREAAPERARVVVPLDTREAAGTLIVKLAPQERAAVVLKDVFELSLDEIAAALGTTVGAVKAALHRGRGKLVEADVEPEPERRPARGAIDAFCEAFNARDLERVTATLLDTAAVEVVGASASFGPDVMRGRMLRGMMFGSERIADAARRGGIEARFAQGALPVPPRVEVRVHRGEPILLFWYAHEDGEAVRAINRFEVEGDRIARIDNYFFTPDVIAEVCEELGAPHRSNGHRWWLAGRGEDPC